MECAESVCPSGADCHDLSCRLNHPPERPPICDQPNTCSNFNCTRLHESHWNPCQEKNGPRGHPAECVINLQGKVGATPIDIADDSQKVNKKYLKSFVERMKDREKSQLPILSYRPEFCQRLERERVLVVTGETGSGKSTQLPQYAAEHFGSLVVCTQPRVVAAVSLARRVAEEYDGKSVGESVGYYVRNANRVLGTNIMFMTDDALIHQSHDDPYLKHIRVIIVDEAHERSLNTDIIIAFSKLLLAQRSEDFYVVIVSAPIDPTRFLHFFNRPSTCPLEVKGRIFPVTVGTNPLSLESSDENLIESHIVSSVLELYPRHEGHILVFLSGQDEIERVLTLFKSKLPNDCIALPLYESQLPKDQEKVMKFNEKSKRMIVLSTNIGETSLTIPNVRLVVDSGWTKQTRYDVKRRLTIIETVRISRSSADQRKDRAGRTSPGHCIRLYEDTELKRENIEPEILRSSFHLVLLQIIRWNLDLKTFSLMDQPNSDVISNSIDLLTKLKCLENQKITKRGELFTELGLDPRLSDFIVDIYTEYETLLKLTAGIVAILASPGNIFFVGGEDTQRIAIQSQEYKSDLIYFYSIYRTWKNVSKKETKGECSLCNKQLMWCTCRLKHSKENGLNNRILQIIDASSNSIIKIIKNYPSIKGGEKIAENQIDIIGIKLAQLFPEQCGYVIVPEMPSLGVHTVSIHAPTNITNTSVFTKQLPYDSNETLYQYFIAMSITQLRSGNHILEKIHPISKTSSIIKSPMKNLMIIKNISYEIFEEMRQKLNTYQSQSWTNNLLYNYDRIHSRFIISGSLNNDKSFIIPIIQQIKNEILKNFSETSELMECGPIKANFESGLICTNINTINDGLRIDLENVPNQTSDQLKDWLNNPIGIEWDQIIKHRFYTINKQRKCLYLIFNNEKEFQLARDRIPSFYIRKQENKFGMIRDNEKDKWGRQIILQTPSNVTEKNIIDRFGKDLIIKSIQLNNKPTVESSIKRNNLILTTDETFPRESIRKSDGIIDQQQRNNDETRLNLKQNENSILPIKSLDKREIKFEKDDEQIEFVYPEKNYFQITFISREAAMNIFSSLIPMTNNHASTTDISNSINTSEWIADGSSTVTLIRVDLYTDFEEIIKRICDKFEVKVKIKVLPENVKRCTFRHGTPDKTRLAASMLAQTFAPIIMILNKNSEKELFNELEQSGELQKWSNELRLDINKNQSKKNIQIQGPQIGQDQLMRRIGDYSLHFSQRFREYELSATIAPLFHPQNEGAIKLREIASRYSLKFCYVSFISITSTIVINGKPQVSIQDIDHCQNEVNQLLNQMINQKDGRVHRCVFCKQESLFSSNLFRICGHAFCRCAAQSLSTFPLQCKDCKSNIHINDIQIIFKNDEQLFMHLIKSSIQKYLTLNVEQDDRVFCPNNQCDGLIRINRGYQTCLTCGESVCHKCQLINDELHQGRTCIQIDKENQSQQFFPQLFRAAKQFVRDHWSLDTEMQPIGRIDENPYLEKNYKSFTRFCKGIDKLGYSFPIDLSKGFFAYHGTTFQAIRSICKDAFDAKRRLRQVDGPGEYFGIRSKTSHGYTYSKKGFSRMILAFILRSTHITTIQNYSYIVNNPINWKYAYNLPVLLITYGPNSINRLSPFPDQILDYDEYQRLWIPPFRWYCRTDTMEYDDTINQILETFYAQWKFYEGSSTIVTPPLTPYIGNTPQIYQIDYKNNRLTNIKTLNIQTIQRRSMDKPLENLDWFYQNEQNNWIRYESFSRNSIEKAFQFYLSGQRPSTIHIHLHSRSDDYKVNFLTGQLINKITNVVTNLKRE